MNHIFENIARENFRSSGYIQHPTRERRIRWSFSKPPQMSFQNADLVRDALVRRERALQRESNKPSILKAIINVLRG